MGRLALMWCGAGMTTCRHLDTAFPKWQVGTCCRHGPSDISRKKPHNGLLPKTQKRALSPFLITTPSCSSPSSTAPKGPFVSLPSTTTVIYLRPYPVGLHSHSFASHADAILVIHVVSTYLSYHILPRPRCVVCLVHAATCNLGLIHAGTCTHPSAELSTQHHSQPFQ